MQAYITDVREFESDVRFDLLDHLEAVVASEAAHVEFVDAGI